MSADLLVLGGLITMLIAIPFSFMTGFTPGSKKNYYAFVTIILLIMGGTLLHQGIELQEEQLEIEMNELCESIDMEFLKKSNGGLFGNSYVLCYDKSNKQIKEIPLWDTILKKERKNMTSKKEIIKNINDQLQVNLLNEDPDIAEWEERTGVLLTINQARKVLELLKPKIKTKRGVTSSSTIRRT